MCIRDRSIADRIGKDNMTQVLEIIRDQMLSTVQKRNMLKLIYGPVSYTHLDVYKRQTRTHALPAISG